MGASYVESVVSVALAIAPAVADAVALEGTECLAFAVVGIGAAFAAAAAFVPAASDADHSAVAPTTVAAIEITSAAAVAAVEGAVAQAALAEAEPLEVPVVAAPQALQPLVRLVPFVAQAKAAEHWRVRAPWACLVAPGSEQLGPHKKSPRPWTPALASVARLDSWSCKTRPRSLGNE